MQTDRILIILFFSVDCVKMHEETIEKKNHIISFYKKNTMVTKGNLNIGQESLLYVARIYLEKVKVSVEDFTEFTVTSCLLKFLFYLKLTEF